MTIPNDVHGMARYIERLEAAIRKHRDQRGDDRCWMDDGELYAVLPEGWHPPAQSELVDIANCVQFIRCRRQPGTVYVSPQRRIEDLEAEVASLKAKVKGNK